MSEASKDRPRARRVKAVLVGSLVVSASGAALIGSFPWVAVALLTLGFIIGFIATSLFNGSFTHVIDVLNSVLLVGGTYALTDSWMLAAVPAVWSVVTLPIESSFRLTGYDTQPAWAAGIVVMIGLSALSWPLEGVDWMVAPVTGFAVLITLAISGQTIPTRRHSSGPGVKVGDTAPDFELPKRDGSGSLRLSDRRGHAVVLAFLRGDWCPMCQIQMRAYQRMSSDLRERGVELIGVSQSVGNEVVSDDLGVEFTIVEDPKNETASEYGVLCKNCGPNGDAPVPSTFLVDAEGTIIAAPKDVTQFRFDDLEHVLAVLEQLAPVQRAADAST